MNKLRASLPFIAVTIVFLATLSVVTLSSVRVNDGNLVYTLDDPYIHMAIAKNLATHGVFGVTRFAFSSSSSSPLWIVLLAVSYRLLGVSAWMPGVLAALFAVAALYGTDVLARRLGVRAWGRFFAALSVAYFSPLIPVVSTGMEHSMHAFFAITLVSATLSFTQDPKRRKLVVLGIAGFLAVGARYESLFLVVPLAGMLVFMKQWRGASTLLATSTLPIIAYGVLSFSHGSYFLPNSLMLKGHFPHVDGLESVAMALGYRGFGLLTMTRHLLAISILLLLGAGKPHRRDISAFIALSLVCSLMLHLQFASVGWFYRYEAYLIAVSLPVIASLYFADFAPSASRFPRPQKASSRIALLGCMVLLLWPLHHRAKESLAQVVAASSHIYRQQYHMADFIRRMYPPSVRVALNDLGAVSFYTDADILDLWGLGSTEVMRAKRKGAYDTEMIRQLLTKRQVDVVMVYSNWFFGHVALPDSLIPVADWTTTDNYFGKTVSFLALSEDRARALRERLRRYEGKLPPSVEVAYGITEQPP